MFTIMTYNSRVIVQQTSPVTAAYFGDETVEYMGSFIDQDPVSTRWPMRVAHLVLLTSALKDALTPLLFPLHVIFDYFSICIFNIIFVVLTLSVEEAMILITHVQNCFSSRGAYSYSDATYQILNMSLQCHGSIVAMLKTVYNFPFWYNVVIILYFDQFTTFQLHVNLENVIVLKCCQSVVPIMKIIQF